MNYMQIYFLNNEGCKQGYILMDDVDTHCLQFDCCYLFYYLGTGYLCTVCTLYSGLNASVSEL